MAEDLHHIRIMGTSLTLKSKEEGGDHIDRVVECLEEKIEGTKAKFPAAGPTKILVLTALFLTDELIKERMGESGRDRGLPYSSEESREAERIARRLIEAVEGGLEK